MAISSADKEKLYLQFRTSLGYPVRSVELTDDQLCILLDIAIEDYSQLVQDWLIEHQWQSLLGHNISTTDMAFALSVRSLDFVNSYTYAYSKQVGHQTNGPWELKKDYVSLEAGRQVYTIPAGREVNEVLWITPPSTSQALLANFGGGFDYGFGGGFAQTGAGFGGMGGMGAGGGNAGYYIAPAFDILLTAADMNLKNRIIRSDLVYKITAGPDGTKLLHLLSTPGSKFSFGSGMGLNGVGNSISMVGCQVWYFYYDTDSANVDACKADNPDVIKMPNQVPLSKLSFSDFNEPTKTLIRQLFVGESKKALGRLRGKFSGVVGPPEAERTMDYETLLTEGNDERKYVLEKLEARLLRLSSTSQLERGAKEATDLNTALKFHPQGFWVK
jgi:hypothetical protein